MSQVYVRRADRSDPLPVVRELLEACRWQELVGSSASVVIKPNLCTDARSRSTRPTHRLPSSRPYVG